MFVKRLVKSLLLPLKIGYHLPRSYRQHLQLADNGSNETEKDNSHTDEGNGCKAYRKLVKDLLCRNDGQPEVEDKSFYQDGFISSLVICILFIAAAFSVSLCYWISPRQSIKVQFHVNQSCLITYMMVACLIMWSLCSYKSKTFSFLSKYVIERPSEGTTDLASRVGGSQSRPETPLSRASRTSVTSSMGLGQLVAIKFRKSIQDAIPLVGLFVFFAIGIFMDVVLIIANSTCLKAFHICNMALQYGISVAFHVCRIIFQATGLAFTFQFHRKGFRQCTFIRYSLLFILAATAAIWFDSLLYQSREIFPHHSVYISYCDIQEAATVATPTLGPDKTLYDMFEQTQELNVSRCIKQETSLFNINNSVSVFLYPLHIEYALLVCEIIFHLYFNVKPVAPGEEQKTSRAEVLRSAVETQDSTERDSRVSTWLLNNSVPATEEPVAGPSREPRGSVNDSAETQDESKALLVNSGSRYQDNHSVSSYHSSYTADGQGHSPSDQSDGPHVPGDPCSQAGVELKSKSSHKSSPSVKKTKRGGIPKLFAPAMMFNIIYITMAALTYLDNGIDDHEALSAQQEENIVSLAGNKDTYDWRRRYETFKIVLHSIIAVSTIFGFAASTKAKSKFRSYSGLHLLVLAATFGMFLQAFLDLIGVVATIRGSKEEGNLTTILEDVYSPEAGEKAKVPNSMAFSIIAGRSILIVSIVLQTTFFFHASRIRFRKADTKRRLVMKEVLFVLSTINLTIWFVDSFIEVKNHQLSPITVHYYGENQWEFMVHATISFILFYRFNTFLIMLSTYFDH